MRIEVMGLLAVVAWAQSSSLRAQETAFRYQPEKVAVGSVFRYEKSNIDGTHASQIALYVAAADRLESFKWSPRDVRATLVTARIDRETFSVLRFETVRVTRRGRRIPVAKLEQTADRTLTISLPDGTSQSAVIPGYPWHSYDFDFASLNFSFPHWTEPEGSFTFGIADVVFKDGGPVFAYKGEVTVQYLRDEEREGVACRKYRIDGAGLENRGGVVWTDRARGHIVDCEIDLPDEPGYTSGKLRLIGIEQMDPEAWQSFMASRLNPSK